MRLWHFSPTEPAKPKQSLIALISALMLFLAACGGAAEVTTTTAAQGATTTTGSDGGTTTAPDATGEPVELTVWAARPYYIPPDEFQSLMTAHPNIKIIWDVQAEDDILQQLQRMKDAGQKMPDVIQDDVYLFEVYKELGLLQPIDEIKAQFEAEDPDLFNLLLPSAWEGAVIDGSTYGMAPATTFDQFYYNIPWLEEAGVQLPFASLEDVFQAALAMKAVRPDAIPFSVQALAGEGVTALKAILNAAGTPFEAGIPDLTSDGGLYVIDWYQRLQANELLPPDAIAWGEAESRVPFLTGNAGLMIDSLSTAFDYLEADDFNFGEDWALTVIPTSRTGDAQDGAWTANPVKTWGVTVDTEHLYEAGLVLRYLAETENLVESVLNGAVPPRQSEALADPRIQEVMPFMTDELKEALVGANAPSVGRFAGEVEAILEQLFGEIVTGVDATAQELADKYQAQLDEL